MQLQCITFHTTCSGSITLFTYSTASSFPEPVEIPLGDDVDAGQVFTVTQPPHMGIGGVYIPQIVHTVRPEYMRQGKYEEACSCGRCATKKVACDHFTKVLTTHTVKQEVPSLPPLFELSSQPATTPYYSVTPYLST